MFKIECSVSAKSAWKQFLRKDSLTVRINSEFKSQWLYPFITERVDSGSPIFKYESKDCVRRKSLEIPV